MKWFFLDAKQRLRQIMANPGYVAKAVFREVTLPDERSLARITGKRISRIWNFICEPTHMPEFLCHIYECENTLRTISFESAGLYAKKVLIQYAIVRALKPETIVETGVANGDSFAQVLLALEKNQRGTLHSIESGDSTYLPAANRDGSCPIGCGDAGDTTRGIRRDFFLSCCESCLFIDLFTHDSLHSYEHMKFEFEQAFPFLRAGGILIADDVLWNEPFWDIAPAQALPNAQILHGVAVLCKDKH